MAQSESETSSDCVSEDDSQSIPLAELLEFCGLNGIDIGQSKCVTSGNSGPDKRQKISEKQDDDDNIRNAQAIYSLTRPWTTRSNKNDKPLEPSEGFSPTTISKYFHLDKTEKENLDKDEALQSSLTSNGNNSSTSVILSSPPSHTRVSKIITPTSRERRKKCWKRANNMLKRMRGEEYLGFETVRDPDTQRKNTNQTVHRNARSMKEPCQSKYCQRSKLRNCSDLSFEVRWEIYEQFWKTMDWKQKRSYVRSMVDQVDAKHPKTRTETSRRRAKTYLYFLKFDGRRKQVCQTSFLGTLGLGKDQVQNWLSCNKENETIPDPPKEMSFKKKGGDSEFYKMFLGSLVKVPSHYCRADTSKEYLEPIFRSKQEVYKAYKTECESKKIKPTSSYTFSVYFRENNYGLHQPKKDRCDLCTGFDAKNVPQDEYLNHLLKKELARKEKEMDKKSALRGNIHAITMDVQKVLLSPTLNASALYYKTKLVVHNFTVYDLATHEVTCFLFDESEAELVSSTFATCLVQFLEEKYNDNLPIVVFSDGCTSQNRNTFLSSALLHFSCKHHKVVMQKYLEKGHTQMECDSVHSAIEKRIRGRFIYVPTDYINICKEARKTPAPYEVKYLHHKDFYDYSKFKCNIRPGSKAGDPVVTDLRQLMYKPDKSIHYKLNRTDEWTLMPRAYQITSDFKFPKLYQNRLALSKRKFQDLQDLLHVIPACHHDFYNNLPVASK